MNKPPYANLEMIKIVANRFDYLLEKVVFLGGSTTGLMLSNTAVPAVRTTLDVDVIIEISTRAEYYRMEENLRKLGFRQLVQEDMPICRWMIDGIAVDIMPTETKILGFSNRWYSTAIKKSVKIKLENDLEINIVTPPYFLATKIEAFRGRGQGDYFSSHDMEDIVTLVDGRDEIVNEIKGESQELRLFLSQVFNIFIQDNSFIEAISGHLLPDAASQARSLLVKTRIKEIIGLG